jgi:CHAT domain-containing protein
MGGYFLALNPDTVVSRYLNLALPPERVRRREGPLHMLAIVADPTDQIRLNPDEWEKIIKAALAMPMTEGQMTLQTVKRATRREIRNALLAHKPDIIQFVGHGIYQDGKGYIALVDEETGKTWLVDDERFAGLYMGHDDNLGLISLATCESAQSDNPQGFLGIAPQLVQRGVPAVIAMQYEVYIKTAKVFLDSFYNAVAARKPIDWATQSARNDISLEFGLDNREFATPVLYMRAEDGVVF